MYYEIAFKWRNIAKMLHQSWLENSQLSQGRVRTEIRKSDTQENVS